MSVTAQHRPQAQGFYSIQATVNVGHFHCSYSSAHFRITYGKLLAISLPKQTSNMTKSWFGPDFFSDLILYFIFPACLRQQIVVAQSGQGSNHNGLVVARKTWDGFSETCLLSLRNEVQQMEMKFIFASNQISEKQANMLSQVIIVCMCQQLLRVHKRFNGNIKMSSKSQELVI